MIMEQLPLSHAISPLATSAAAAASTASAQHSSGSSGHGPRFPSLSSSGVQNMTNGNNVDLISPSMLQRRASRTSPVPASFLQLPSTPLSAAPSLSASPSQSRISDSAAVASVAHMLNSPPASSVSVLAPPSPVSPVPALSMIRTPTRHKPQLSLQQQHPTPANSTAPLSAPLLAGSTGGVGSGGGSTNPASSSVGGRHFAGAGNHLAATTISSNQGGGRSSSADPSRAGSPIRFQVPLTLPGHMAAQLPSNLTSVGVGAGMGSAGSSHILSIGVGSIGPGLHGRGIISRGGSISGGYTPQTVYLNPPQRVLSQGTGLAQPLQAQLSKSVGHSSGNSGHVTFKGTRPTAALILPGVMGRVSRAEEEESASQRARESLQQQQWQMAQQQLQLQQIHLTQHHSQQSLSHSHSQPHFGAVTSSSTSTTVPYILSPLVKSPSANALNINGSQQMHNSQAQQAQMQQHDSSHQSPTDPTDDAVATPSLDLDALNPSTSVLPASSSHRRICSLPLYVSTKKPRAYRTHITYAELGGVVKENSIGGGKSAAEALASLSRPLAAAADASLIDESSGHLFDPQRHTQAYKSHFQKKSHQAVFALFAALDQQKSHAGTAGHSPTGSVGGSDGAAAFPAPPSSPSPPDSLPDVGLFYAQFFRAHFIELMEAHFPTSSQAALAMLGSMATDRTSASSLAGSGLSPDETKLALHAVVSQAIRSMQVEAHRAYPAAAVVGSGCSFCILLISGGVLYTYNSSFVTSVADSTSSPTSSQQQLQQQFPDKVGRQRSHQRGSSGVPVGPPPFQVTLCRAGKGIDVSGSGVEGNQFSLPSTSTSTSSSSTALAGSFGFNSLLLSSASSSTPRADLGGAGVITDRMLAPQDDFVVMAASPLYKGQQTQSASPSTSSLPSTGPSAFSDMGSLCSFILATPTPQGTVNRLVAAHSHAVNRVQVANKQLQQQTQTQQAPVQYAPGVVPPLLFSIVYF